ncbi:winged helix-turn-helix transcriptional regulator [Halomicrobium mukohataei]|uniref:Winged helix-turn-helix transcriptional regulator n=1 Tax=Halomicrobium mukohataei TaxID=57705 RepID=A0A847UBC4_9EURY|nr:MarR family transcriptional regulator [Halomicrobium mukohataei]NLV10359.1 winged helix-turn-helix transcriptional regulator [Halomicrobium mukohataei]
MTDGAHDGTTVLQSKRSATQYQILIEIAERQPAVSQQEIADSIGITSQAVSNYLQDLVENEFVQKHGRGRYEVTKEGVDWLITQTTDLREFVDHVSDDVIGEVEIETAIATTAIEDGQAVSLTMRDGVLHATPGEAGTATAVAVSAAEAGRDVGITDFDGVLEYDLGTVTIVSIPPIRDGGSGDVDHAAVAAEARDHDLLAVSGTEAVATAHAADLDVDIQFATAAAVAEAATKGLDVCLLAVADDLAGLTDTLRNGDAAFEIVEYDD